MRVYLNDYKNSLFFFSQNIIISGNSINFDNNKIKTSDFYNKNKKIFNRDDTNVNKILVSKRET